MLSLHLIENFLRFQVQDKHNASFFSYVLERVASIQYKSIARKDQDDQRHRVFDDDAHLDRGDTAGDKYVSEGAAEAFRCPDVDVAADGRQVEQFFQEQADDERAAEHGQFQHRIVLLDALAGQVAQEGDDEDQG